MIVTLRIFLLSCIASSTLLAQPGNRPAISVPEPDYQRLTASVFTLTEVKYNQSDKNRDSFPGAVQELVAFFKNATTFKADLGWNKLSLDSARLMQTSMLYMTGNDAVFMVDDTEKKRLGKYLRGGDMLFAKEIRQSTAESGLNGLEAGISGTPCDRQWQSSADRSSGARPAGAQSPQDPRPLQQLFRFPLGAPDGRGGRRQCLRSGDVGIARPGCRGLQRPQHKLVLGHPLADGRRSGLQFGANLIVFAMTQRAMGDPRR